MDYECGSLGILVPTKGVSTMLFTGERVDARHFHGNTNNTVQHGYINVPSVSRVCATILDDEPWFPKWLYITGRNVMTEHAANLGYRKVLLQYLDVSKIVWLSTSDLAKFCWDEQQQLELLAKLSPTGSSVPPAQTC